MRKPSGRAGRTLAMAAMAAAVVAAAAGCGVRPTSVLSAGSMPVADGRASTITVYLVKDRALYPAVRPGLPGHPYLALAQLGVPVTSEERRAGLYTDVRPQEISVTQDGPPGTVTVWVDDPGPRGLRPGPGSRWPRLALAQLGVPVTSEERRAGLYTDVRPQEISVTQDGPPGTVTVWVDDPGPRGLRPGPGSRWPRLALAQVACTAQAVPGVKGVLLEAPDEASGHDRVPLDCGDFADLR